MNDLTHTSFGGGMPLTMSSREIADLCSKRHDHVLRDTRQMLMQLYGDDEVNSGVPDRDATEAFFDKMGWGIDSPDLGNGRVAGIRVRRDARGFVSEIHLDYNHTMTLVAGYNVKLRKAIIDKWQELEAKQGTEFIPSYRRARIDVTRECRLTMAQNLRLAKMIGLNGNQAALSANRATVAMTGVDTLNLMGITHIDAPQPEALLAPTDIGKRFGVGSAMAVNKRLCELGLQQAFRDAKGHIYYEPTDAGIRAGGVMQDTGKRHSSGTPVRQLRWASSVIDHIRPGETA